LQLQFGGAVGTLASLGEQADAVSAALAAELQLPEPAMPWHTQRDRMVRLGAELGILCGGLGKLARDLAWLCQPEVGELAQREPVTREAERGFKRGACSVMPHKNNPVAFLRALAAAERAPQRVAALLACMPQELERGLGGWQAELAEMAGLLLHAHGSVRALSEGLAGLRVFPARMREQIDAQRGLVFAEALNLLMCPLLGREAAHAWVEELCRQIESGSSAAGSADLLSLAQQAATRQALMPERLAPAALAQVFDVEVATAHADRRVAAVLQTARRQWAELSDRPHW
jgi:3-carboxy-cis,cis-muconate cycloisomerase